MLTKILGAVDLLTALIVLFSGFIPGQIIVVFGFYLLIKGALFNLMKINIVSVMDIVVGAYLLLGVYTDFSLNFFRIIFFLFLVQKGAFSLF